jgi:hypothetical protein
MNSFRKVKIFQMKKIKFKKALSYRKRKSWVGSNNFKKIKDYKLLRIDGFNYSTEQGFFRYVVSLTF